MVLRSGLLITDHERRVASTRSSSSRGQSRSAEHPATSTSQTGPKCESPPADNSRKNIGIATDPSGVVVIDLDDSHGATAPEPFAGARNGQEVLTRLAAQAGAEVPTDTITVLTPSVIHGNPAWCQHCLPRPEPVTVDIVKSELSTGAQQRDVATAAW